MRTALTDAGISPDQVDHINSHGTGTKYNDVTETQAIKAVFGKHAYRMPVTSIKSMLGHMMGAAGAVEAVASVLAIRHGIVPPTINYTEPDPDCDLDIVANAAREQPLTTVLSNSAGIGGCNAAIVLKRAANGEDA
jgi:3-oxoacyl-[acyl-carrier-protein] synthase II